MRLFAASSATDTDFTAKLVDVYPPSADYPDGFEMNLTDGIVRARYRNAPERAELSIRRDRPNPSGRIRRSCQTIATT